MRPCPATTPSPGMICSSIPKSRHRWVTSLSTSWKLPGSNRVSIRSRAVSLPASCWRRRRSSPPPSSARRSSSSYLNSRAPSWLFPPAPRPPPRQAGGGHDPRRRRARRVVPAPRTSSDAGRLCFLPVLQELLEADVGQRVLEQLLDERGRAGTDVRPEPRGLDDVEGIARGGDEHF